MVKLRQGPGNAGPADAPSTQPGIGIEIWLPTPSLWNGRIHNLGGGGYQGTPEISAIDRVSPPLPGTMAYAIAGNEGAVSAVNDTGHVTPPEAGGGLNGDFLMLPDGSINRREWEDFAERGIHVMALKTKALATAFYHRAPKHAYFEGCSTGGRQALKEAQAFPDDYDGIIAGAPAIKWTTFITGELYPQLVMQREFGHPISVEKLDVVSAAAVSACDQDKTGKHIGYILDPDACHYNPATDRAVLCLEAGGTNATSACLTRQEADAVDKIWYGQTVDGRAPDPTVNNGYGDDIGDHHLWFGPTRGTQLILAMSANGQATPFPIATSQVALNLQDGTLASPMFRNAAAPGRDGWKNLSYADLFRASREGHCLQEAFSNIDTNSPDLDAFHKKGGKLLLFHGMADQLIPIQGTNRYFAALGKRYASDRDSFVRYVQIAGMGHCFGVGSVNGIAGVSPPAAPILPADGQFYHSLTNWVEQGRQP